MGEALGLVWGGQNLVWGDLDLAGDGESATYGGDDGGGGPGGGSTADGRDVGSGGPGGGSTAYGGDDGSDGPDGGLTAYGGDDGGGGHGGGGNDYERDCSKCAYTTTLSRIRPKDQWPKVAKGGGRGGSDSDNGGRRGRGGGSHGLSGQTCYNGGRGYGARGGYGHNGGGGDSRDGSGDDVNDAGYGGGESVNYESASGGGAEYGDGSHSRYGAGIGDLGSGGGSAREAYFYCGKSGHMAKVGIQGGRGGDADANTSTARSTSKILASNLWGMLPMRKIEKTRSKVLEIGKRLLHKVNGNSNYNHEETKTGNQMIHQLMPPGRRWLKGILFIRV